MIRKRFFAKKLIAITIGLLLLIELLLGTGPVDTQAQGSIEDNDGSGISNQEDTATETYRVKPDDTLSNIALVKYGNASLWRGIYAANIAIIGPNPTLIKPGQVLKIPAIEQQTTFICHGQLMTEAELANYRGIDSETLKLLQTKRGLTHQEICNFPDEKLERAIRRALNPKPDRPDEALAFRHLQLQDENGFIPPDGLNRAIEQARSMETVETADSGIDRTAWTWLGPGNIGGRVRSVAIHPTNPNIMWLGSVSGGIWQTTNGGTSWQVQDDFMANMAVSTLAIDSTNPNILYAGAGEGFYNIDGIRGAGVFRTTNGGGTWTQLASTANPNWYFVNRLSINPNNNQTLLAATRSGIWRTTDGGTNWNIVHNIETLDVDFHPTNGNLAIAGGWGGGVWFSTNGGQIWTAATGIAGGSGRVEIAYAPSNPNIVYASVEQNSGEIYASANGGQTYTLVNTGNNYLGGQGWYDNIIWVDPTNNNTIIVGGIDLWRSTDGGATLTKISQWQSAPTSAHADHHFIIAHPNFDGNTNRTVYFGNDGGVYRTNNVYIVAELSGWQELNNGLGITQFYGAAGNPTSNVIVGGTQDNGTLIYTPATGTEGWTEMFGGDGGFSAADPTNANVFYGEYVNLQIHRSTDGGASASYIFSGIADAGSGNANFIAPFILDSNNSNTMLAGGRSLWRSNNVQAVTPTWAAIKPSINDNISAIAITPGNSAIIWVGHNGGNVYMTTNGTTASPTWTQVDTNGVGLPNRFVTRITVDPHDPTRNTVYVTFGGFTSDNVWRTTDGGANWTNITGIGVTGLPDAPIRSMVVHPSKPNWLYVGTEVGIFTSEDGGTTWGLPHDGPTNTSVDELFWMNTTLVAATHGRGLFMADVTKIPSLTVTKTASPDPAFAGSPLAYTIRVTNTGNVDLTATITDTLPLSVATSNPTVWSGISIPVGGFWQQVLNVTVDPHAEGPITNIVEVTTEEGATGQFELITQVIPRGKIIVDACPDQDADGDCGPGAPLPLGVLGCLRGEISGDLGCKPVPALFTGLDPNDTFTPYLKFTDASQGHYQTTRATGIQVKHGEIKTVTLGAVYPVHPTGIAVHQPSNKVYAAFQGAKIGKEWPYPFVAVMDSSTDEVLYTIPGGASGIGRQPWGVAVSGNNVYVGSYGEGRISVIDTTTDAVIANVTPSFAGFQPAAPALNPRNGQVHFPDTRGRRMVILDGTAIAAERPLTFLTDSFRPLEIAVADDGRQGHSFISMRTPNGTQTVGIAETEDMESQAALPGVTSLLPPPMTFNSSYAISLWQQSGASEPRLFVTYADNSRPGSPYPNPNRLVVYTFSPGNPSNLLQRKSNILLPGSYAEAGLIFDETINGLIGLYGGFDYDNTKDHIAACSNPARGGVYGVNFNGGVMDDPAPSSVVGNPPLTTSTTLAWRNPYELAVNPNNGKVYVTDRCWNEFPAPGGGYPGGGAVLVFNDSAVQIISDEPLLELGPQPFIPVEPTTPPILEPEPTATSTPTMLPVDPPTPLPTDTPTPEPTLTPTSVPTSAPSTEPEPTVEPTLEPTGEPTAPVEPTSATIFGQVTLSSGLGGASITIDDTGQSVMTDSSGVFNLADVVAGPYNAITADAPGHLPAVCTEPTITAPETTLASLSLLGGDLNDSQQVDIADLALAASSYGQTGADLAADLNADGMVNILDLQLIAANFGQGVQVWSCQ